jgi:hypothetical protein
VEDDIVAKLIPILVVAFLAAIPISAQFFAYRKRKADLAMAFLMESLRAQLFVLAIAGLPLTLGLVHLAFHFLLTGRDEP